MKLGHLQFLRDNSTRQHSYSMCEPGIKLQEEITELLRWKHAFEAEYPSLADKRYLMNCTNFLRPLRRRRERMKVDSMRSD